MLDVLVANNEDKIELLTPDEFIASIQCETQSGLRVTLANGDETELDAAECKPLVAMPRKKPLVRIGTSARQFAAVLECLPQLD